MHKRVHTAGAGYGEQVEVVQGGCLFENDQCVAKHSLGGELISFVSVASKRPPVRVGVTLAEGPREISQEFSHSRTSFFERACGTE